MAGHQELAKNKRKNLVFLFVIGIRMTLAKHLVTFRFYDYFLFVKGKKRFYLILFFMLFLMYDIIRNTSPSFISRFIRSTFISTENKKKPMFNGSIREDTYLQREGRQMVQLPRPPTLRIFPLTFSSRKRMEKKKGRK